MTDSGTLELSGSYDRHLYMENTGFVRFGVYTGQTVTLRSPAALNDGQWHHVVGTQGAAAWRSTSTASASAPTPWPTPSPTRASGAWVATTCSSWPNAPTSNFLAGLVDDVRSSPALSRQAVAGHYAAAGGALTIQPRPTDAYGAKVYDDDPDLYWRLAESSGTTATDSSYRAPPGTYGSASPRAPPVSPGLRRLRDRTARPGPSAPRPLRPRRRPSRPRRGSTPPAPPGARSSASRAPPPAPEAARTRTST